MDWLKIAKKLPTGGKDRVVHDCGSGKAAQISNGVKGYSFYCHRCGDIEFVPHGQRSFKELMELKRINKAHAASIRGNTNITLPSDFSLDIPPIGMLWLLKASITPFMARKAGIGWSDFYQRVVLPVYNDDNLVFYQMRAVHDYQDIKYLNPSTDRRSIAYWCIPENADTNIIVLTEDILSAIRVGQLYPAVSMLGTKISEQQASQIASTYTHAIIWLDPDEAGEQGARKIRRTLSLAMQVHIIHSDVDPKNLPNRLIKTYVEEALC